MKYILFDLDGTSLFASSKKFFYRNKFMESFSSLLTQEGKSTFKEKVTPMLRDELEKILHLGSPADSGKRIALALKVLEHAGFEIPAAIYNFSQSQQRLQGTLDGINNLIKKLSDIYCYMSTDNYDLKGIDFKNLYELVRLVHSSNTINKLDTEGDIKDSLEKVFNDRSRANFNNTINSPEKLIELCKHLVANYEIADKNSIFNDEESNKAPIVALKEFVAKFEKGKLVADQLKTYNVDGSNYFNNSTSALQKVRI